MFVATYKKNTIEREREREFKKEITLTKFSGLCFSRIFVLMIFPDFPDRQNKSLFGAKFCLLTAIKTQPVCNAYAKKIGCFEHTSKLYGT